MPTLEFLWEYFTSPVPSSIVLSTAVIMVGSTVLFNLKSEDSRTRSKALWILSLGAPFLWLFVTSSVALCTLLYEGYEYNASLTIKTVLGGALATTIVATVPISMLVREHVSRTFIKLLNGTTIRIEWLNRRFQLLSTRMGLNGVALLETDNEVPLSIATDGKKRAVVLSRALYELLSDDEIEAVLAHELAHIKNRDTNVKGFVSVYSRLVPVDIIMRLVEPAVHRERELLADEVSAQLTRKPLALASALLKIDEAMNEKFSSPLMAFSILGFSKGIFSRHPPLRRRIGRLLKLAEYLGEPDDLPIVVRNTVP